MKKSFVLRIYEYHIQSTSKCLVGIRSDLPFGIEHAHQQHRGAGAFKMLRVTVVESSDSCVRLRVEGRLTGRSIEELGESCELHALADGMRLTLDLGDVS